MIRSVSVEDAADIAGIYNHYIRSTIVTFETTEVTDEEMSRRIRHHPEAYPFLVYCDESSLVGYAYASAWRSRAAYSRSVETTVYVRHGNEGQGIGSALYRRLIRDLSEQDFHVAIGGISLPNPGSVALHEKFGFAKCAHFHQVGWKLDRWIDVGYWQKVLDQNPEN